MASSGRPTSYMVLIPFILFELWVHNQYQPIYM